MSLIEHSQNPSGSEIPARSETVDLAADTPFSASVKRFIGLSATATELSAELSKTNEERKQLRASILHALGERKSVMTIDGDIVTWKMVTTHYKAKPAKPARVSESQRLTVIPGEPQRAN